MQAARQDVLAHLGEILADRRFVAAERNARFLRYVVERTLEGKADEIKETVIATEVYGRAGDYDPKSDSIVRVEATRLRQKLRSYYEAEGKAACIRIELPTGTYVPRFEVIRAAAAKPQSVPIVPLSPSGHSRVIAWSSVAAVVLVVFSFQFAHASRAVVTPHPSAVDSWKEGVALLQQDPHSADTNQGAPPTLLRAIERLEYSVATDPTFAHAWATLAEAYDYAFPYVGRNPVEDAKRAEAAARRAVAIDPALAAGHHMLGLVEWMMKWDFAAAELSYRRALELDPRNVYAVVEFADLLRETGRTNEAADLIHRSRALLPGLPQLAAKEAEIQLDLGRTDAAIASANAALGFSRNHLRAHVVLGMAEERRGNSEAALHHYRHVLSIDSTDRRALPAYGYLLARTGDVAEARRILQQLEQMNATVRNCAFQIAVVRAGLGDGDAALHWLDRAWRTHQVHFPFVVVEDRLRGLHGDSRFRALLARANLPIRVTEPRASVN